MKQLLFCWCCPKKPHRSGTRLKNGDHSSFRTTTLVLSSCSVKQHPGAIPLRSLHIDMYSTKWNLSSSVCQCKFTYILSPNQVTFLCIVRFVICEINKIFFCVCENCVFILIPQIYIGESEAYWDLFCFKSCKARKVGTSSI